MTIEYLPPVFRNFGADYPGRGYFITEQSEWMAKHSGMFVMSALEDSVRVWALADAFTHDQVIGKCNAEGRILGGGDIGYSEEQNRVGLSGGSMDFGSLPNSVLTSVLTDYFQHFQYSVGANMNEEWVKDPTKKWFREHEVVI